MLALQQLLRGWRLLMPVVQNCNSPTVGSRQAATVVVAAQRYGNSPCAHPRQLHCSHVVWFGRTGGTDKVKCWVAGTAVHKAYNGGGGFCISGAVSCHWCFPTQPRCVCLCLKLRFCTSMQESVIGAGVTTACASTEPGCLRMCLRCAGRINPPWLCLNGLL